MSKQKILAMVLLILAAIVFIINRERTSVDLLVTTVKSIQSFVFLGFTALGVVIGVLLK
ncbi:MAG TPA: hypothetical protein P5567_12640 [Kiritimatiellia bacterium]|nr:hypothetical protein [Kiritimatiellia bacterium]HRZ13289.1 hypothetical protein [Kiritimatiellia bacterium]HSA18738.1 hypothetical protein [Kiritimatiellia bacterium]